MDGEVTLEHKGLHLLINESNSANLVLNSDCIFFGEVLDFENPAFSNKEIADTFENKSLEEKITKLNKLGGFFLSIFISEESLLVFNDAAGQLETFIYHRGHQLIISSQPTLILPLIEDGAIFDLTAPEYIVNDKVTIFNKTPFRDIEKLAPNFFYDTRVKKNTRFFPSETLPTKKPSEVSNEVIKILEGTFESLSYRGGMALAITAGLDSRVLFATSLTQEKINYYVFNHPNKDGSIDVEIAKEITSHFKKDLKVIEYDLSNVDIEDSVIDTIWKDDLKLRKMSHIMKLHFPNVYLINGNISEVARNYYDPLPRNLTTQDICNIIGVKEGSYEIEAIQKHLEAPIYNIHLLDIIYWEHKMANWAASAKSLYNLHNTVISPFNNRYLLSLLLSTERKDRDKYFHKIYHTILSAIDTWLTEIPINPTKKHRNIILLKRLGLYRLYRSIFFKLRKLKL